LRQIRLLPGVGEDSGAEFDHNSSGVFERGAVHGDAEGRMKPRGELDKAEAQRERVRSVFCALTIFQRGQVNDRVKQCAYFDFELIDGKVL
jgi:hypothetical protein